MSTELEREAQLKEQDLAAPLPSVSRPVGELPDGAPWAILAATAVLVGGVGILLVVLIWTRAFPTLRHFDSFYMRKT